MLLAPVTAAAAETPDQKDARMAWWRDARFGMFIHWGLYAVPAGEWKGKTDHAEWIRHTAQIPVEEYDKFVGQFNPVRFDAEQWVRLAKQAGMKYIVITSKHHDGFCLWDSARTDYDVASTPFKRDILRELTDACKKHGVRLCFYHSIMDWHHPDYLPRRPWEAEDRPAAGADFARYTGYMKDQLAELVADYDPGVLWFDGEWEDTWTHEMGVDLYDYVRGLKGDIIINNRVDKGRRGMEGLTREGDYRGDFGTPEQEIPDKGLPGVDWESCMTMNDHWGWNKSDKNWKSGPDLIRKLIDIASKGGNFLLNIGPRPDGTFPDESVERLEMMGRWMQTNGEAIYGATASPFDRLTWGRCTKKLRDGGATLYLHVFDWPADGQLLVPGLRSKVTRAYLLAGDQTVKTAAGDDGLLVSLPAQPLDPVATVVVLDVTGELKVEKVPFGQAKDGTMTLPAELAEVHDVSGGQAPRVETKYGKPSIGFWIDARDWIAWSFEITKPGDFTLTAEIACQADSTFDLKLAGRTLTNRAAATGGYDKFKIIDLGKIAVDAPGPCTVEIHPTPQTWNPINLRSLTLTPISAKRP
jgi:alpha-L-fucosidase